MAGIITPEQVARDRSRRIAEAEAAAAADVTGRYQAEKTIVARIVQLAKQYDAMDELAELDITIPNLLQLATAKGVTDADLQSVKADVAILVLDLLAKEGGDWQSCWNSLKEHFKEYVQELLNS